MKIRIRRVFCLISVLAGLLLSFEAFAATADYTIESAGWSDSVSKGQLTAVWERRDTSGKSATRYKIRLYRGSRSSPVGDWYTAGGTAYDFTSVINKKGSGSYFYEVYPAKGGEGMAVTSETLEVDSTVRKNVKNYLNALQAQVEENWQNGIDSNGDLIPAGWELKDGKWYYRNEDRSLKKSSWLDLSGKRYYLSVSGEMVTGWQAIDSRWYYFDDTGALFRNGTTPDGYTVNANGEWIENGEVMTDDRKKARRTDSTTVHVLREFSVALYEKAEEPGQLYGVTFKNTNEAQLVGAAYSVPQEKWVLGQPVTITVVYRTYAGYSFADSTKYTCSKASVVSQTGDSEIRTLVLSYMPALTLKTPENFYLTSDHTLHWDAVPHAGSYEVRLINDNGTLKTKNITSTIIKLEEYMGEETLSVRLMAKPSAEEKTYVTKSSYVTLEGINGAEGQENLLIPGKFSSSPGGSLTYKDENGETVRNRWIKLAGKWYHFNANGEAEKKGWYLDTTGYWYYFDEKHRMVTGGLTADGVTYHLNAGERTDIPEGARY